MRRNDQCQRWRDGRDRYRPAQETIDTDRHEVHPIDEATAKLFVQQHHYSRSYPAARARYGLFRKLPNESERLVGCAVYSVPMNQHAIPKYTGLQPNEGVELGRFVLLDEVEAMGESWFLGQCSKQLRLALPDVQAVLSYSDPTPRTSIAGEIVKPGHIGTIYQATNATHVGRSTARTLLVAPDGTIVSERTLAKLRGGERGAEYAYKTLRDLGAPARGQDECVRAYVRRILNDAQFRRLRHPGNLAYVFSVGSRSARRRLRKFTGDGLPYPKQMAA